MKAMIATQTATKCQSCGRILTSTKSIAAGRGPVCQAKIAAAAKASTAAPALVAKAIELIEDGALVHWTRNLFLAVSTDGTVAYEVDAAAGSCTCPAGVHGRPCYHVLAARIVLASVGTPVVAKPVEIARPADPFAAFADAA
jgi:Family of unknown function (DUF6011)/SWIM zinc finger